VGTPLEVGNKIYSPFDNREIYEKYWESTKNNQYLFSVVEITKTEKDTLNEIFFQKAFVPDLFVVHWWGFLSHHRRTKKPNPEIGFE